MAGSSGFPLRRSRFLITLTTNHCPEPGTSITSLTSLFDTAVDRTFGRDLENLKQIVIFLDSTGPWGPDRIKSVNFTYSFELGAKYHRLHSHVILEIIHRAKIFLDRHVIKHIINTILVFLDAPFLVTSVDVRAIRDPAGDYISKAPLD